MDKELFIERFAEQFDDTPADAFALETEFRGIKEWDSMVALMVIAMVDDEYGVKLTGEEIRNAVTVADICTVVENKL